MADLGTDHPLRPAAPRRRGWGTLRWIAFLTAVALLATLATSLLTYHTGFLRVPVVAEALCGPGRHIVFHLTRTYIEQTDTTLEGKQVACVGADGKVDPDEVNYAMLKVWSVVALVVGAPWKALLVWRARRRRARPVSVAG